MKLCNETFFIPAFFLHVRCILLLLDDVLIPHFSVSNFGLICQDLKPLIHSKFLTMTILISRKIQAAGKIFPHCMNQL